MQLSGKTNRKNCRPARHGTVDSRSDPELLIPQLCNLWFCFFLFCFKLKYPLMAVEGFPDSPNSFQGRRLKIRMVLFVLQHRSLLLHVPSLLPAIPSRCKATITPGTFPGGCVTSLQHCCCHPSLGSTWGTIKGCMELIPEPDRVRGPDPLCLLGA